MKKLIAIVLSSLLLIGAAVGGTLALASDEERTVNVYTAGNIDIALVNGDNDSLTLFPAVYNFGTVSEKKAWELNDKGYWDTKVLRNVYQKDLAVKNVGKNDAYIRVIVAYENPKLDDGSYFFDKCVVLNEATAGITRTPLGNAMIDGTNYALVSYLFADKVTPDKDVKHVVLRQLAIDTDTTSEQMAKIGGAYDIMVCAQAVQTDLDQSKGGNSPEAMLNAAFYKLSDTMHPWAAATEKAGYTATAFPGIYTGEKANTYYVFSKNGLMNLNNLFGSISTGEGVPAQIELMADIDLLGEVWEPIQKTWVTFEGNGHTIKNLNAPGMCADGRRSGFWASAGGVKINGLTLENVTVNGSQAGIFAGHAEGLKITNCYLKGNNTVNFVAGVETWNGIGAITGVAIGSDINVTILEGTTVTLNKAGFTTDPACTFIDNLTGYISANNGTIVNKGKVMVGVSTTAELIDAIKNAPADDETVIYLTGTTYDGDIKITVADLGKSGGDVVIKAAEGKNPVIAGTVTLGYRNQGVGAETYTANITFEGVTFNHAEDGKHSIDVQDVKSLTLKNCTIIGDGEYGITSARGNATGTSKIVGCTFENAAMQLLGNLATGLVIDDCTFNNSRVNVQAGNGVTVQNCEFNATLKQANVDDSFYMIRSNSTPITVKNCEINIDSELTSVATSQATWYLLANRGTTNWTVENVAVMLTDAALEQTELKVTVCTKTGVINTTNLTVNGVVQ